jgi:hypothetical protein
VRERKSEREREEERDLEYGCFIFIFKRNDRCLGTFKLSSIIIFFSAKTFWKFGICKYVSHEELF